MGLTRLIKLVKLELIYTLIFMFRYNLNLTYKHELLPLLLIRSTLLIRRVYC
jgi:hypothetical protein